MAQAERIGGSMAFGLLDYMAKEQRRAKQVEGIVDDAAIALLEHEKETISGSIHARIFKDSRIKRLIDYAAAMNAEKAEE